jgi:hypothetical protein
MIKGTPEEKSGQAPQYFYSLNHLCKPPSGLLRLKVKYNFNKPKGGKDYKIGALE